MESGWQRNYFNIADHHVGISFRKGQPNSMELIPSFEPFRTEICSEACVMELKVDDTLPPVTQEKRKHIRVFDTGNGDTAVDVFPLSLRPQRRQCNEGIRPQQRIDACLRLCNRKP